MIKAPFGKQYHTISSDVVAMTLLHWSERTKISRKKRNKKKNRNGSVQIRCWRKWQTKVYFVSFPYWSLLRRETDQSETAFELRGKLELILLMNRTGGKESDEGGGGGGGGGGREIERGEGGEQIDEREKKRNISNWPNIRKQNMGRMFVSVMYVCVCKCERVCACLYV